MRRVSLYKECRTVRVAEPLFFFFFFPVLACISFSLRLSHPISLDDEAFGYLKHLRPEAERMLLLPSPSASQSVFALWELLQTAHFIIVWDGTSLKPTFEEKKSAHTFACSTTAIATSSHRRRLATRSTPYQAQSLFSYCVKILPRCSTQRRGLPRTRLCCR